jgi:hypothetical protein
MKKVILAFGLVLTLAVVSCKHEAKATDSTAVATDSVKTTTTSVDTTSVDSVSVVKDTVK